MFFCIRELFFCSWISHLWLSVVSYRLARSSAWIKNGVTNENAKSRELTVERKRYERLTCCWKTKSCDCERNPGRVFSRGRIELPSPPAIKQIFYVRYGCVILCSLRRILTQQGNVRDLDVLCNQRWRFSLLLCYWCLFFVKFIKSLYFIGESLLCVFFFLK